MKRNGDVKAMEAVDVSLGSSIEISLIAGVYLIQHQYIGADYIPVISDNGKVTIFDPAI